MLLLIRRERGPEGVSGGVRREVGLVPVGLALEKTYELHEVSSTALLRLSIDRKKDSVGGGKELGIL